MKKAKMLPGKRECGGGGGGARTPDLRINPAPSVVHASTTYKYDALTDCAG